MSRTEKIIQMPAPAPVGRRKNRVKLTDAVVAGFPLQGADPAFGPAEKYPAIYYDTELNGFHVLCHRTSKSYYVQHDVAGKSVIVCLGRTNQLTAQKARKLALTQILEMKNGVDPNAERRKRTLEARVQAEGDSFTLADAVRLHLYERKKERSKKTILEYERFFETHLRDFMSKPMTWLGAHQDAIENLHDAITRHGWNTEERKGRGRKKRRPAPYSANGMVRAFRAVYNYARQRKPHLNLPEFRPIEMNPEAARDSALTLDQLPVWYAAVMGLPNPVRRDFQLFTLFTGNRSTATCEMRWEDVDLGGKVNGVPSVFIPTPKGGRAKAFYIPLSDYLVTLLQQRKTCKATNAAFPNSPWVFPAAESKGGHIQDPTEKRHAFLAEFTPHALRHSYITLAQCAGVNQTDIRFLANHRPKGITEHYMKALLQPLRERQQQITNYIKDHLNPASGG